MTIHSVHKCRREGNRHWLKQWNIKACVTQSLKSTVSIHDDMGTGFLSAWKSKKASLPVDQGGRGASASFLLCSEGCLWAPSRDLPLRRWPLVVQWLCRQGGRQRRASSWSYPSVEACLQSQYHISYQSRTLRLMHRMKQSYISMSEGTLLRNSFKQLGPRGMSRARK